VSHYQLTKRPLHSTRGQRRPLIGRRTPARCIAANQHPSGCCSLVTNQPLTVYHTLKGTSGVSGF